MKFLPSLSSFDSIFDQMFSDPFFQTPTTQIMRTDIKELDTNYILEMDIPGFKKEDISLTLDNGYLTISAITSTENEEKDVYGNILKKERNNGSCSRSFYVGDEIKEADISASYEDGELKISLPKINKKEIPERKQIPIQQKKKRL